MAASFDYGFPMFGIIIFIIAIGANAGLAFIPAYMAKNKGYSFGGFWCISFFASFLVGIIIAACITDKTTQNYAQPQYPPYQQPYGQAYAQPGQFTSYCSKCGHGIVGGDAFCPGCGTKV
jgi:hypothetical protein